MNKETQQAIRKTIDYLDSLMQNQPNAQIAQASNLLEDLLAGIK